MKTIKKLDLGYGKDKENGAVYVIKTSVFIKENTLYGRNHKAFIMPKKRLIDINNLTDLKLAELSIKRD